MQRKKLLTNNAFKCLGMSSHNLNLKYVFSVQTNWNWNFPQAFIFFYENVRLKRKILFFPEIPNSILKLNVSFENNIAYFSIFCLSFYMRSDVLFFFKNLKIEYTLLSETRKVCSNRNTSGAAYYMWKRLWSLIIDLLLIYS